MSKYTAYGEEIDNYIEKNYLNKIIKSFIDDCRVINCELISIILFGGFGKGEGSMQFINDKNNSIPIPYNDFDFYIVTDRKLNDEELNKISINASKAIGMGGLEIAYFPEEKYDSRKYFHVDVRCIPYSKLNRLINIQRYYELKYGSQVIYGDYVLDKINIIKPDSIPPSDGLRNLFNRFHQMLLGLRENYNDDQKKIKIFWSFKCYLSICEALLILEGKFMPTTKERAKLFNQIYEKSFPELYHLIPNLHEKVKLAADFKLKPYFNVNHDKLWMTSLNDLIKVFEYYIKKMTEVGDIEHAINKKLPYIYFKPFLEEKIGFNFFPAQYMLNLGYFKILKNHDKTYYKPLLNWKDVGLRMIIPVYYLLKASQENKSINPVDKKNIFNTDNNLRLESGEIASKSKLSYDNYLDKAYNELQKFIKLDENMKKDFWCLRGRALKAFGLYYQQRLL